MRFRESAYGAVADSEGHGDPRVVRARSWAQIAAGVLLVALVVFLAVIDAFSTTFALDPIVLGLLLGAAGAFLYVGALGRLLK